MPAFGVTFEPGCRNNWHIHHAKTGCGQTLIVTAGEGCYQEWGKPARRLRKGDTVNIPANVKHWHGAAPDCWFQHIALEAPDLSTYDTIYLGYPNWWADAPMIVYSFLDKAKIDGKTILPFCTHEGSGLGSTARKLAAAYPKAKVEIKRLSLYGHVAQNEPDEVKSAVAKWLKQLGK